MRSLPYFGRRGPDSHKLRASTDGIVEFLHARLSIVDSGEIAHQPLVSSDGMVMLAFNGEVYNYRELREELSDYPFRSQSDTEVILAGYIRHGLSWMKRLRGMFSVAIADETRHRVYLIRDPVGKKPLFVAQWKDGIYFGSSVVSLAASTTESVSIDETLLSQWWELGHAPAGKCLLRGANVVLPGDIQEYDWEGKFIAVHSCTPNLQSIAVPTDSREVREQLEHLLKQSVTRRLENNPKPNLLLSGGIDSTIIAKYLTHITDADYITLGSFVPYSYDERYARFAARRLGVKLTIVRPNPMALHQRIVESFGLQDEPLAIYSLFPLSQLCRLASKHGRVLFTGDGGDEVFLGYGDPKDWCRRESGQTETVACGPQIPEWFSNWGRSTATNGLLGHMFAKLDRASAEQAVEARCPLLDWDLMVFARSLSYEALFPTNSPKALLKTMLDTWPDWFTNRPKNGFAYSLRWAWAMTGFRGLRNLVESEAQQTFDALIPKQLKGNPQTWKSTDILQNFGVAWRLATWSSFLRRLREANDSTLKLSPGTQVSVVS